MAIKNTKLEAAVRRTAEILEVHPSTLSAAEAKAMLKDIRKVAVNS